MDGGRGGVVPFSSLGWHSVRTAGPRADPDFLHHHQLLLPVCEPPEWRLGSEVGQHPPAGLEHRCTSRSAAAYGGKAGTRSCVKAVG